MQAYAVGLWARAGGVVNGLCQRFAQADDELVGASVADEDNLAGKVFEFAAEWIEKAVAVGDLQLTCAQTERKAVARARRTYGLFDGADDFAHQPLDLGQRVGLAAALEQPRGAKILRHQYEIIRRLEKGRVMDFIRRRANGR